MNKIKRPLVLLSGGLDSSFMLEKLLDVTNVDIMYVSASQHPLGHSQELIAIDKIINALSHKPYSVICRHKVDIGMLYNQMNGGVSTSQQGLMWVTAAMHVINIDLHSMLCVGYVKDDNLKESDMYLKDIFRLMQKHLNEHKEPVPIRYPLLGDECGVVIPVLQKYEMLKSIDHRLLPHIWVCECPTKKNDVVVSCKSCKSCKLMAKTTHLFKFEYNESVYSHYLRQVRFSSELDKYNKPYKEITVCCNARDSMWATVESNLLNR